jgi:two-component system, OmpR family, response regulator
MAGRKRVLVVDDDPNLREVVRFALDREGFSVLTAGDGRAGLRLFREREPDLVILDILMPEMDGTEACREIRKTSTVPIVFLSSKDDELDRVLGLELGGDDYVTKPFSPRELVARVRAILRRVPVAAASPGVEPEVLAAGELRLDLTSCRASWRTQDVVLTAMEFALLRALLGHPRKVFSRDELMDRAYGGDVAVSDRTIDSHVRRIRKKFQAVGCDPIETVTGFGYRLAGSL